MKQEMYSRLSDKSSIGISVDSDSLEAPEVDNLSKYTTHDIKRLTKANSFLIIDEVFHIGKKEPNGKASMLYHVTRMRDKRYVCPSVLSKEDTIEMVKRKYFELDT